MLTEYHVKCLSVWRFITSNSPLRRSGMARVNQESQFYLPPTRLFTSGMVHTYLCSAAAERHRTLAGTRLPFR